MKLWWSLKSATRCVGSGAFGERPRCTQDQLLRELGLDPRGNSYKVICSWEQPKLDLQGPERGYAVT